MPQSLLEMAKDLVMAQIKAGRLSTEDMHRELQKTYASLMELKTREEAGRVSDMPLSQQAETSMQKEAVPIDWRKSITRRTVTCLECSAIFKQLTVRHLGEHGLDTRSYRVKYGIPRTQPLAAKDVTALRKKIVQQTRPWEKSPMFKRTPEQEAEEVIDVNPEEQIQTTTEVTPPQKPVAKTRKATGPSRKRPARQSRVKAEVAEDNPTTAETPS